VTLPTIDARLEPELVHSEDGPGLGSFKAYWCSCLDAPRVIEPSSVALGITSPPYPGVDQPSDGDGTFNYVTFLDPKDFDQSHLFLDDVWRMMYGLLADLGRLCINIYDIPRGEAGMLPNVARVTSACLKMGFVKREEFIWRKGASHSPPVGSFPLPKGVLSGNTWESILVFQKPLKYQRRRIDPSSYPEHVKKASMLDGAAQKWLMDNVWDIPADRTARKLGHPFPFPEEIPERLIKLYSMATDIVFDPFGGAGTTAVVAQRLGRHGVMTELSRKYVDEMISARTAQQGLF
jgi:modification methylase